MPAVTLPSKPGNPHELEEYVAALFQAAGYFVEKNIIERDLQTHVLELDVVATSYDGNIPLSILVEAKSGKWHFADIFKVIGWMRYLEIQQGAFFVSKNPSDKDPNFIKQKVAPLNVSFVYLEDFANSAERFTEASFPDISDPLLLKVWRYAYWIERELIDKLRTYKKTNLSRAGPSAAVRYHDLINNGIFFMNDFLESLKQLYGAYIEHPRLSYGIALEMDGGEFDPSASCTESTHFREAMYDGKHDSLQSCFYLEHRARLSILKTAIDWVCLSKKGFARPTPSSDAKKVSDWLLPVSFREGLNQLKKEPYFERYALFWQVFLWGFGGFYLEDRKNREFEWMAEQTGIPIEEIPRALRVFDVLFPLPQGSWLTQAGLTQCKIVKLVPTAFRGLGVNQRFWRYGYTRVEEFGYKNHTAADLQIWSKNVYDLLAPLQSTNGARITEAG